VSRRGDRTGLALAVLLLSAAADSRSASPVDLDRDGWHRWEVPAGTQGESACCYRWHDRGRGRAGCRLGGGDGLTLETECEVSSGTLQVFVEVKGGRVRDIRSVSAACPVETDGPVHEVGTIATAESIAWLTAQVADDDPGEEALLAISMHEDGAALKALTAILEDRGRSRDVREQALFWLVQSPDDAAYRYLDNLLSRR